MNGGPRGQRRMWNVFAIIQTGGRQVRVDPGSVVTVDRVEAEVGKEITFDQVLLLSDGEGKATIGTPYLKSASVTAEVVDKIKGDKTIAVMYKRRKGQKKKSGHRQPYLRVKITGIAGAKA